MISVCAHDHNPEVSINQYEPNNNTIRIEGTNSTEISLYLGYLSNIENFIQQLNEQAEAAGLDVTPKVQNPEEY